MKLFDELETFNDDSVMSCELAQVYCLRSIAVSLECLAVQVIGESKGEEVTEAAQDEMLSRLDMHSVRKGVI